jgi:uncharacterized protein YbjT (DUF2867 family)
MRIAIAGGHGKIALLLTRLLADAGDEVRGLVRSESHVADVRSAGGEPVLVDLEAASLEDLTVAIDGVDAVVFAAGAGPGSGAAPKETVDYQAAVDLAAAARRAGVGRDVMVSAVGADPDHPGDEVFDVYLRAKGRADAEVLASGLDVTVIAPVGLTDDPPTGRVAIGAPPAHPTIPRADVAAVLAETLRAPETVGATLVVCSGDTPVAEAVAGSRATPS